MYLPEMNLFTIEAPSFPTTSLVDETACLLNEIHIVLPTDWLMIIPREPLCKGLHPSSRADKELTEDLDLMIYVAMEVYFALVKSRYCNSSQISKESLKLDVDSLCSDEHHSYSQARADHWGSYMPSTRMQLLPGFKPDVLQSIFALAIIVEASPTVSSFQLIIQLSSSLLNLAWIGRESALGGFSIIDPHSLLSPLGCHELPHQTELRCTSRLLFCLAWMVLILNWFSIRVSSLLERLIPLIRECISCNITNMFSLSESSCDLVLFSSFVVWLSSPLRESRASTPYHMLASIFVLSQGEVQLIVHTTHLCLSFEDVFMSTLKLMILPILRVGLKPLTWSLRHLWHFLNPLIFQHRCFSQTKTFPETLGDAQAQPTSQALESTVPTGLQRCPPRVQTFLAALKQAIELDFLWLHLVFDSIECVASFNMHLSHWERCGVLRDIHSPLLLLGALSFNFLLVSLIFENFLLLCFVLAFFFIVLNIVFLE